MKGTYRVIVNVKIDVAACLTAIAALIWALT